LAFLKLDFEILAFVEHAFFGNEKKPGKSGLFWLIFSRQSWAVAS